MHQFRGRVVQLLFASLLGLQTAETTTWAVAEPPTEPLLRIEAGMHTARIGRIDVDAQERYLVTASDDKTVRVWDLPTGRLLRVLRPPIGSGNEGKMYAVAISPNGDTIVASGWTSPTGFSDSIYLFDRATGQLRQRISGLPNTVYHLAFRPDGEVFVATLANNGMRVYRARDGAELARDEDYAGDSYNAAFDSMGRLVTSCFDGFVRLYSSEFIKLAMYHVQGGANPYGVSFSPDGQFLAIGLYDTVGVRVLSGQDLSLMFAPDTSGVSNGDVSTVTWSADGRVLYAGGQYDKEKYNPIVRWGEAGHGAPQEIRIEAEATIMDMKPLQNGGVVYGTADPAIGLVNTHGDDQILQGPKKADYRGLLEYFRLSADGSLIRFAYKGRGQRAEFSVPARLLTLGPPPSPVTAPRTVASDLTVEWENTYLPALNEKTLRLIPSEMSRSLAISYGETQVLVGTDWYLRLFDRKGDQQWERRINDVAWSVNIPSKDRVAVAALGDGTIRWYRLGDGEELLALFPHPDGQRWILWTPQGYYDAGAGAEDLLGWHVNQGPDREAIFYPVAQFREQFYRPDVISLVLETLDVDAAFRRANATVGVSATATGIARSSASAIDVRLLLQPAVEILSPKDGSIVTKADVVVEYLLRSPNAEAVDEVTLLVDGRAVKKDLDPLSSGGREATGKILVSIPRRDATIALVAKNQRGTSEMKTARLRWGLGREEPVHATLRVLSIGVGEYPARSNINRLMYPGKDAREVASLLNQQQGAGLYEVVTTEVLADEVATHEAILNKLEELRNAAGQEDVTMVFLSGHGLKDAEGEYFFLSVDADKKLLRRTAVRGRDLSEYLTKIPGKVLFFIDTCYSGGLLDLPGAKGANNSQVNVDELANELASTPGGPIVFASSTGRQLSLEREEWKNGAFSKALLEAFSGKADKQPPYGVIDVIELHTYVRDRVSDLTAKQQTPRLIPPKGFDPYNVTLLPK